MPCITVPTGASRRARSSKAGYAPQWTLDPPFTVLYPRLVRRTMRRVIHGEELWNGNRETWRDQFASRESIFYWTIRAHLNHRRTWPALLGNDPRLVHLRSDAEAQRWLESLPEDALT